MGIFFNIIFFLHGLIHLLGFIKAFGIAEIKMLAIPMSKIDGILWLITALLFLLAAVVYNLNFEFWWLISLVAVMISQVLIIFFWKDAWAGTIGNAIIFFVAVINMGSWNFKKEFISDVEKNLTQVSAESPEIITESDLDHLPDPVKKYLKYVGVVGKPGIQNFRIKFNGEMRDRDMDWFPFTSLQYNFYEEPARLFFIEGRIKGLPVKGYHKYMNGFSGMEIKLLSLIPVVDVCGQEMLEAETVTVLNDMCLLAPAALLDDRIRWEKMNDTEAKVIFTNSGVTVSAVLYFNEKGQLINFVSNDRYAINDMKKYPFSTPVDNYQEINGYKICTYGEAVWHYPEGEFVYGKFKLQDVEYNVDRF